MSRVWDDVYDGVDCPYCLARRYERCKTSRGTLAQIPHLARIDKWNKRRTRVDV